MKKNNEIKNIYTTLQANPGSSKPTMPVTGRQTFLMESRHPDPSSVTRSDRYPIPSFEPRMRAE
jgi:hypothetical protein